jgi:transposase
MPTNARTGRKEHVRCDADEIMRLDKTGIRRAEIAERLDISQSSVDRIIMRERRKTGLAPPVIRSGAATLAIPRNRA